MLIPFATRPAQPMYCRFTPAVEPPCFSWPVSSSAPTVIRLRRLPAGRGVQPGRRVLPDLAHRRGLVPRRPVQQPLGLVRRPVARLLADRPPVPRRQVADQRVQVLPGLQPRLRPRKARPEQPHQGRPLPQRPPCPYPGISSRLVFICHHKHMIPRRLPLISRESPDPHVPAAQDPIGAAVLARLVPSMSWPIRVTGYPARMNWTSPCYGSGTTRASRPLVMLTALRTRRSGDGTSAGRSGCG